MIRFISGTLAYAGESEVVVDHDGIGYEVNVPGPLISELPGIGEKVKLYTYLAVREDAMQLFGFLSYDDLVLFRLLITVNGIGPKAALGILGTLSAAELCYAVVSEDEKKIAKSPGIGPKTAKKLILELKDRPELMGMVRISGKEADAGEEVQKELSGTVVSEAIEALVVLGYSKTDAAKAVHEVELTEGITVEEVLKQSLRNIM